MKKLFFVILVYLFSQVSSLANERDTRLNQLFNELKANKSKVAFIIEQEIWALWSTHPGYHDCYKLYHQKLLKFEPLEREMY